VRHKNVVQFIGACTRKPNLCIIFEYMSGGSVYDWIRREGPLKLSQVRGRVVRGVAWRVVWCGVVWCGVVWCGVAWRGVAWRGVAWRGVAWRGVVWCLLAVAAHRAGVLEQQEGRGCVWRMPCA
jgi:hypothetical protein